jgi:hypothetical protein
LIIDTFLHLLCAEFTSAGLVVLVLGFPCKV